MYQQYPESLAEEVVNLLNQVHDDDQRIRHNIAVKRIKALCSSPQPHIDGSGPELAKQAQDAKTKDTAVRRRLSIKIARVIIDVAGSDAVTIDVETAQRELGQEADHENH
jgi:hypothetical protein